MAVEVAIQFCIYIIWTSHVILTQKRSYGAAVALLCGSALALCCIHLFNSSGGFCEGLINPRCLWRGSKIIAIIAGDVEGKLSESTCRGRKENIGAGLSIAHAQIASSSRERQI